MVTVTSTRYTYLVSDYIATMCQLLVTRYELETCYNATKVLIFDMRVSSLNKLQLQNIR